jgi:uncharacterized protein YjbI with pentapeptide repeats
MPYVFKHRRPPEPWHEFRKKTPHRFLLPAYYVNWLGEWSAYFLGKWSIFEVLEYVGSFSILVAVIFYFADAGNRLKQKHYQAWQVINTAQGKGGSGGRVEALQELNEDRVPLVGVDVSDAYLQEIHLIAADLRRSDFRGADARGAVLRKSTLEGANLRSINLRRADLSNAQLLDANLYDADLTGATLAGASVRGTSFERADLREADLAGLTDWKSIRSIKLANLNGIRNAPADFIEWAKANGAVDLKDGDEWDKLLKAADAEK